MTLYAITLFLHVAGALGVFAAFALETAAVTHLRRVGTAEQAREWSALTATIRTLGPVALVLLLVPGIYMAASHWRGAQWPWIGLAAMVLLPALGAPSGIRLARIQRELANANGPLTLTQLRTLADPLLQSSIRIRIAVSLGIVYLMTVKPGVTAALAAIGVAVALGSLWSVPVWTAPRTDGATVRV